MINLDTWTAKETADYFSRKVNSLSFNLQKTAEELKSSKQMRGLDLCFIKILSAPSYKTDLRNEKSAMTAQKLMEIPFVKRLVDTTHNSKMEETSEILSREHRTLQQVFSGLVFYHFMITCSEKECQILLQNMGDSFFLLPFI